VGSLEAEFGLALLGETILLSDRGSLVNSKSPDSKKSRQSLLPITGKQLPNSTQSKPFMVTAGWFTKKKGRLRFGLWSAKPGLFALPAQDRLGWSVFQKLSRTARVEAAVAFARKQPGEPVPWSGTGSIE
jgi:hypothetical protein